MATREHGARMSDIGIPPILHDKQSKRTYTRGKFLGKGGFAKCYEITDNETQEIFAGKIVPKSMLFKPHQKDKMKMEIDIHRNVSHKHIVRFFGCFEDSANVYVVLELCRKRSFMELHKRRRAITEPETRYFLRQLLLACQYLHENNVIHRDLKLGNLFLNDDLEVKIGDFGLATRVDFAGERKKTLCGTPNYIAPEVLGKKGHSFEVDIWSIGCILYTLLVGKPPFETTSLKDTYSRIRNNIYHVPSRVGPSARSLITRLLRADPQQRPNIADILNDDFFRLGYLPRFLPASCLTMPPRFQDAASQGKALVAGTAAPPPVVQQTAQQSRKILSELNGPSGTTVAAVPPPQSAKPAAPQPPTAESMKPPDSAGDEEASEPLDFYLSEIHSQLVSVVGTEEHPPVRRPSHKPQLQWEEAEDPACQPFLWVSKWVDYSDKYGLGYQLCDDSFGVLFNDSTRLLLLSDGVTIQYIDRNAKEEFHLIDKFPADTLSKKVTLLKYFRTYMSEHLLKAGGSVSLREAETIGRLPFLRTWFRTRSAIILHLSNGTLQINFFHDHTKLIVCPLMGAVSYIDTARQFRTYKLKLIEEHGCCRDLESRLKYAVNMVDRLVKQHIATNGASGSGPRPKTVAGVGGGATQTRGGEPFGGTARPTTAHPI